MTDKSAVAIREFIVKYVNDENEPTLLPDLTALISEGYVSKEEHNKVLQQRDELREALQQIISIDQNSRLFNSVSIAMRDIAEAAIKNTYDSCG